MFPSAIIALVHDEHNNVLLLRQSYISTQYCNLVSGYIKPGETAEQTAIREIMEETGQKVDELQFVCSNWFEKKQMMMLGFFASVKRRTIRLSQEVDSAQWMDPLNALKMVHPLPTSTSRILTEEFINHIKRDQNKTLTNNFSKP